MKLKLSEITIDPSFQLRAQMDEALISDYQEAVEEGARFEPVTIWRQDGALILIDGFHRIEAHKRAGCVEIDAEYSKATTKFEALLETAQKMARHGLRWRPEDKRNAISKLISADPDKSTAQIAKALNVSDHTVMAVRESAGSQSARVKGKDGKSYPAKVKREPKEREESGDDETDAPPPDSGLGGAALSPEELSKSTRRTISKADAVAKLDAAITATMEAMPDIAAGLIDVKVYVERGAA